jgi:hypothetical protein
MFKGTKTLNQLFNSSGTGEVLTKPLVVVEEQLIYNPLEHQETPEGKPMPPVEILTADATTDTESIVAAEKLEPKGKGEPIPSIEYAPKQEAKSLDTRKIIIALALIISIVVIYRYFSTPKK